MTDDTKTEDLVARLLAQTALPLCPYDRRSPDYWTTNDTDPCEVCGQLNDASAPVLCRGADTSLFREAASRVEALEDRIKALEGALEPFAQACEDADDDRQRDHCEVWESPLAMSVNYGDFRRARAALRTDAIEEERK